MDMATGRRPSLRTFGRPGRELQRCKAKLTYNENMVVAAGLIAVLLTFVYCLRA